MGLPAGAGVWLLDAPSPGAFSLSPTEVRSILMVRPAHLCAPVTLLARAYRRRQGGIYRFALNMSGSSAVAEEVTQEVFMTVIRDGSRFDAARGAAGG